MAPDTAAPPYCPWCGTCVADWGHDENCPRPETPTTRQEEGLSAGASSAQVVHDAVGACEPGYHRGAARIGWTTCRCGQVPIGDSKPAASFGTAMHIAAEKYAKAYAAQPCDKWFEERNNGGSTHCSTCWQRHPRCAYLMGRMEASLAIEAAAEDAARTSRDFGRGFMEAARVARRYYGYDD